MGKKWFGYATCMCGHEVFQSRKYSPFSKISRYVWTRPKIILQCSSLPRGSPGATIVQPCSSPLNHIRIVVLRLPDSWSNENLEMLVLRRGENRSTHRKTSLSKGENQQLTQPTYGIDAGIWTRPHWWQTLSLLHHPFAPSPLMLICWSAYPFFLQLAQAHK